MSTFFAVTAAVAVLATALALTRTNPVHALLYFALSLLAVALVLFALGAPFAAALVVIISAGAIIVLLLFVVMLVDLGKAAPATRGQHGLRLWGAPVAIALVLGGELVYALRHAELSPARVVSLEPAAVALSLFGPYVLGVELASLLLLSAVVGAVHIGRREPKRGRP
jgi:NADH-quinone oxidoreductase subunit J